MSYDKTEWRRHSVSVLKRVGLRYPKVKLWDGGHLRYPFLEMAGSLTLSEGTPELPEMYTLLRPCLKNPEDFVAVDLDPKVVYTYARAYERGQIPYKVHFQDAYALGLNYLKQNPERPTAVLNYDDFGMADATKWWQSYGRIIRHSVDQVCSKIGFCVMFLNKVLDPFGLTADPVKPSKVLEGFANEFYGLFQSSRSVDRHAIITHEQAVKVDDTSFARDGLKKLGGVEVYRSKDHHHRMVTLRVLFTNASGMTLL